MLLNLIPLVGAAALSFLLTYALTPLVAKRMEEAGKVGVDVHKPGRPRIPEMGGLSILASLAASSLVLIYLYPARLREYVSFILTVLLVGAVGAMDDLKPLNPRLKPFLTAVASLPLVFLGAYDPHPALPFIGRVRLTIVYPLLIPFGIAVPANAVNMMDVLNGVMPGTCGIVSLTALASLLVLGRVEEASLPAILLGALLAFYAYNKFPAKVFSGDVGSLSVGAALGAIAILGRIEVVMVVAMMPHIMNAFYGLSSIGRLYERREIQVRPIRVLEDGRLAVNPAKGAPITLTRIILAQGPLTEKEVLNAMLALTAFSSALAMVTLTLFL